MTSWKLFTKPWCVFLAVRTGHLGIHGGEPRTPHFHFRVCPYSHYHEYECGPAGVMAEQADQDTIPADAIIDKAEGLEKSQTTCLMGNLNEVIEYKDGTKWMIVYIMLDVNHPYDPLDFDVQASIRLIDHTEVIGTLYPNAKRINVENKIAFIVPSE